MVICKPIDSFTPPDRAGNAWCEMIKRGGSFWQQSTLFLHLDKPFFEKTLVISRKNLVKAAKLVSLSSHCYFGNSSCDLRKPSLNSLHVIHALSDRQSNSYCVDVFYPKEYLERQIFNVDIHG